MDRKSTEVGREAMLRSGLAHVVGKSAKVKVQGKEVRMSEILDALDTQAANAAATEKAKLAYREAVAVEQEYRAAKRALLTALRAQLRATLSGEELAACGLARASRRELSAEERVAATLSLRDTRRRNGTLGEKQRREAKAKAVIVAAYAEPATPPPTATPGDAGRGIAASPAGTTH
jgi:hypothetical protein